MPELNENDLSKLFRTAGHHAPPEDLTARIMARVSVTPIARPVAVRPVIGRWGWMALGALLLAMVVLAFTGGSSATSPTDPYVAPVLDVLRGWQLPQGNWPIWMIGASLLALLFVAIDRAMGGAGMRRSGS